MVKKSHIFRNSITANRIYLISFYREIEHKLKSTMIFWMFLICSILSFYAYAPIPRMDTKEAIKKREMVS